MDANQRRDEIIRILVGRRFETMPRLAIELGVSRITIVRDILALTSEYPLETTQGNGGGVKLADWYRPNRAIFTREQQQVLTELLNFADEHQSQIVRSLINTYGHK